MRRTHHRDVTARLLLMRCVRRTMFLRVRIQPQDCATLFTQEWTLINIIAAARGDFLRPLLDPAAACSSEVPRGHRGRIFAIAAL